MNKMTRILVDSALLSLLLIMIIIPITFMGTAGVNKEETAQPAPAVLPARNIRPDVDVDIDIETVREVTVSEVTETTEATQSYYVPEEYNY